MTKGSFVKINRNKNIILRFTIFLTINIFTLYIYIIIELFLSSHLTIRSLIKIERILKNIKNKIASKMQFYLDRVIKYEL